MVKFKAPRGTPDWLPERATKRKHLEKVAADLFERYGYEPISTPIFETTELFIRSIGEATEIVQKEMYTFKDKGDRELTLRPEGTAPIVRAFLEHSLGDSQTPLKLYYCGPMFRYERPQAGRYRQFWQMGVEAIGSADPALDAETIVLMLHYFESLGLGELELLLNSMGCGECRPGYTRELQAYFGAVEDLLCADCQKRGKQNPLRVFDCKNERCKSSLTGAPVITDFLCQDCEQHFGAVQRYLKAQMVEYTFSPLLVRGFDYYTKTTFEVVSPVLGAQNALGGGGRYDNLVEEFGGPPTPAIGFALGTERIIEALEKNESVGKNEYKLDVFLVWVEDDSGEVKEEILRLAGELRQRGLRADLDYGGRSLKAQMKQADRRRARSALILGPDELERKQVTVRDMETGNQQSLSIEEVVTGVKSLLG